MMWRLQATTYLSLTRSFSTSLVRADGAAIKNKAASSVLKQKIHDLMTELEKEDAYLGPITANQRTSDVRFGDASHVRPDLDRLRVVPSMMSFYMANPALEEALRSLQALVDKYYDLPTIPENEYQAPSWIDPSTVYGETKSGISAESKKTFVDLLNRLARIEPQLQTTQLQKLIYEMRDKSSAGSTVKIAGQPSVVSAILRKSLDSLGRSRTVGRRKTSSALVYMARAEEDTAGQIYVNGRSLEQYFPSILQRRELLYPLNVVNGFAKFNIFATVHGGGQAGQASAVGLAVAKGLGVHNPLLISRLMEAKCLYRDNRKKERKKPGKAKARKSYGWVKR